MENFLEIADLIKKQDSKALKMLYEHYGKKFYSYCVIRWHLNEDEGWEVVYKTLEALVLKLSNYSFDSQRDFERFIFRVLINFLRQQYRSAQAKAKDIEFIDIDGVDSAKTFEKYLNASAVKDYYKTESFDSLVLNQLTTALEKLEEIDRDLLLLRAQNFTYEEIAVMLQVDDAQLKVRHHRAKKKLIEVLNSTSKYLTI
jgi:RNA polymerase sigma-70 factor (ECF subfamily)